MNELKMYVRLEICHITGLLIYGHSISFAGGMMNLFAENENIVFLNRYRYRYRYIGVSVYAAGVSFPMWYICEYKFILFYLVNICVGELFISPLSCEWSIIRWSDCRTQRRLGRWKWSGEKCWSTMIISISRSIPGV